MDYAAFLDDYRAFIATLPGTVNLPNGWFQNWRGWDMWQCERVGLGATVLDVGALHTFGCLYWAAQGRRVVAVDSYYWATRDAYRGLMAPEEWEYTVELVSDGYVVAMQANAQTLPFLDARFETVVCLSTIEHVHDDRAALAELVRVVVPGGHVYLTTEYEDGAGKPYSEDDGSYYRVYNAHTLAELVAGYAVKEMVLNTDGQPFTTAFVDIEKGKHDE